MDYSLKEDIIDQFFDKVKYLVLPSENNNYKSKFLQSNLLLSFIVFIFVLKIAITLVSVNIPQNIFFADITKSVLENYVNQTRQSQGLTPLSENIKLDQAANLKAQNMVQNNYFDHTSPTGVTPWFWFLQAGYKYKYAGENLAIGFYDSQEVYNAWLNSPSHKANIMNPNYTEVGTAIIKGYGGKDTIIVVQEFASPLPTKIVQKNPVAVKNISTKTQVVNTETIKTQTVEAQAVTVNNSRVLSQSTEIKSSAEVPANTNNLISKTLNYSLYNSDKLLQNIIYGISLIMTGVLLTLIFFNFNVGFKKQLIFRAVLIVGLLSVATLLNKEIIVSFIPHQILI